MKFAWKQIAVAISYMAMELSLAAIGARAQTKETAASAEDARKFIEAAEQQLFDLAVKGSRTSWVEENFITEDTEQIAANANEQLNTAAAKFAKEAHRFDSVQLSPELARKRMLLELATGFPAPDDPKAQKELAQILASLDGDYGRGKWCPDGNTKPCLDVTAVGAMLELGRSKPWPDALKTLTGEKQMDASALADYFAPLKAWLDDQNKNNNYPVGW